MNIYAQENPWLSFEVSDQVKQYLDSCRARRLSSRTIETYSFYLDWLTKWCHEIGVSDVRELNPILLRQYMQWAQQPGARGNRSPYTLHGAFRVMRSFFQFLVNDEVINSSPVSKLNEPKLPKRILPALNETEIRSIIEYWSEWEKKPRHERTGLDLFALRNLALFYFLLDTGLRVEEASRVLLSDVDLKSGRVFVRCGKGEKDRITFLSPHSLKYLVTYLRMVPATQSGSLWIGQYGALSAKGMQMIFKRLSREIGIRISPHRIRRTFAITMLRNGADLYRLKELMGHEDIRTLERYLDLCEDDLKEVHIACSPISRMK